MHPYQLASKTAKRKRRSRTFRFKLYSILLATLLILFGATYLIRESPLFTVRTIHIAGFSPEQRILFESRLHTSVFDGTLTQLLGEENYLSWLHVNAKKLNTDSFAFAGDITLEKSFLKRRISILASPREKFGIWCADEAKTDSCSWIDEAGVLLDDSPFSKGQLLFTLLDERGGDGFEYGQRILEDSVFDRVVSILTSVRNQNISVDTLTIMRDVQEFSIKTTEGTRIIFNLRHDVSDALGALRKFLTEYDISDAEYIDLTVQHKIFWKSY